MDGIEVVSPAGDLEMKIESFNALLSTIYETTHDLKDWSSVVDALCRTFEANHCSLLNVLPSHGNEPVERVNGRSDEVFCQLTCALISDEACRTPDSITLNGEFIEIEVLHRGYDLDFPWMIGTIGGQNGEQFLLANLSKTDAHAGAVGLSAHSGSKVFSRDDAHLLSLVLPHVRRVRELDAEKAHLAAIDDAALLALDRLSFGAAFLSSSAEVIRINSEAKRIFTSSDGVAIFHRRLRCTDSHSDRCLADALRHNQSRQTSNEAITFLVARPSGKRPYIAWSVPVEYGGYDVSSNIVCTMIVLHDLDHWKRNSCALRELYELTPSEVEIAMALGTGADVSGVAESRHVSINTVRAQRAQIYAKIGIGSLGELIRTLAALPQ
jgi:DNA-binding CsgD family transcriptional regulator